MECLQYLPHPVQTTVVVVSFKPYYNWNTFNTKEEATEYFLKEIFVLNLIISGMPSILNVRESRLLIKEF